MKNASLPIAIAIGVLGLGLTVNAYLTKTNVRRGLDEERYKRMMAEENMQKTKSDMDNIRTDLAAAQQTLKSIQELVNKGQDATSELKGQLDAVRKERDALKLQLEKIQVTTVEPAAGKTN